MKTATSNGISAPLNVAMWITFAAYVMTLPMPHVMALRNLAFVGLLLAIGVFLIKHRFEPEFPLALPWMAYSLVASASLFYAVDFQYSSRNFIAEIVYGSLIFASAASWAKRRPVLNGLVAIVVLLNIASLVTLFAKYPIHRILEYRFLEDAFAPLPGVCLNSNFLISVFPLHAYGVWALWRADKRYLATALSLLILVDIAMMQVSGNRQNMLALATAAIGVVLFAPRRYLSTRSVIAFAAVLAVIVGLFVLQTEYRARLDFQGSVSSLASLREDPRWDLWRFSIEKISEHPLYGGGFGREVFEKLYSNYKPDQPILWHAHNMILNKGIQMGVPGMVAFLWLWGALFKELIRYARSGVPGARPMAIAAIAVAIGVFMKNMSDDFFFRDPALLFWLQMGVLLGEMKRAEMLTSNAQLKRVGAS